MLRSNALTPEAAALAPFLCAAIEQQSFTLAGGTGLALQLGHRVSVDFDWFCKPEEFPRDLAARFARTGQELTVLQDTVDTFECLLSGVKCSFFAYEPALRTGVEHLHGRPLATIEDIGVMKLVAVSQRGSRKDFFDIYEICRTRTVGDLARRARTMLERRPVNPLHVAKSLVYFDDAEMEPDPVVLSGAGWEAVKGWFVAHAREHTAALVEELAPP